MQLQSVFDFKRLFSTSAQHLRNSKTVFCVFEGCSYKTNIYGLFRTHRSRNHNDCSINDLKSELLEKRGSSLDLSFENHYSDSIQIDNVGTEPSDDLSTEDLGDSNFDVQDLNELPHNVELKVTAILLKLEHIYVVPNVAVDELLQEFDYLINTASVPLIHQTLAQHLQNGYCQVCNSFPSANIYSL